MSEKKCFFCGGKAEWYLAKPEAVMSGLPINIELVQYALYCHQCLCKKARQITRITRVKRAGEQKQ